MQQTLKEKIYNHEYYIKNKAKENERSKVAYWNNPEYHRQRVAKYIETHQERYKELAKKWLSRNLDKHNSYVINWNKKSRMVLFDILGGSKCSICGFDDIRALHFDHINGGGNQDRKRFSKSKCTINFIRYYINNPDEAKKNLQVLCSNCNWIKRYENKEFNPFGWNSKE